MSASNYLELEILDHTLGVGAYTMPTAYLALCTDDPTDAGTGASMNEVANSYDYARVALASYFGTAAASGEISNDAAIEFATANGGNWGTITYFAIVDSGTHGAGNLLYSGALTASKTINDGETARFAVGELTISAD